MRSAEMHRALHRRNPVTRMPGIVAGGMNQGNLRPVSAAALLTEHAPPKKKGLYTAWLQASMGMSNILGALVAFVITSLLPTDAMIRWGWRIPFVIGLSIVPLGLYLRRTLEETPVFLAEANRVRNAALPPAAAHESAIPPKLAAPFKAATSLESARPFKPTALFKPSALLEAAALVEENASSLLCGFGIAILWAVAVYVLLIFMPVFLQQAFGFTAAQAFGASLVENVCFVGGCFAFGAVADRVGHSRLLGLGAIGLLIGVPLLFLALNAAGSTGGLMGVLAGFGLLVSSFTSGAPMVLSGLFPTRVRATGVSITYNAAFTIFGGFAPAILTWFNGTPSGSVFAPAWYVEAAA